MKKLIIIFIILLFIPMSVRAGKKWKIPNTDTLVVKHTDLLADTLANDSTLEADGQKLRIKDNSIDVLQIKNTLETKIMSANYVVTVNGAPGQIAYYETADSVIWEDQIQIRYQGTDKTSSLTIAAGSYDWDHWQAKHSTNDGYIVAKTGEDSLSFIALTGDSLSSPNVFPVFLVYNNDLVWSAFNDIVYSNSIDYEDFKTDVQDSIEANSPFVKNYHDAVVSGKYPFAPKSTLVNARTLRDSTILELKLYGAYNDTDVVKSDTLRRFYLHWICFNHNDYKYDIRVKNDDLNIVCSWHSTTLADTAIMTLPLVPYGNSGIYGTITIDWADAEAIITAGGGTAAVFTGAYEYNAEIDRSNINVLPFTFPPDTSDFHVTGTQLYTTTINDSNARIRTSTMYDSEGIPDKFLIYLHGRGEDERSFDLGASKNYLPDSLNQNGYTWATVSSGNNWGNEDTYISNITKLYEWCIDSLNVEKEAVLCCQSMGGIAAYNLASNKRFPIKTVIAIMPVINIIGATEYSSTWKDEIKAAFGITDDAGIADSTLGYDPYRLNRVIVNTDTFRLNVIPSYIRVGNSDDKAPWYYIESFQTWINKAGGYCRIDTLGGIDHTAGDVIDTAEYMDFLRRFK